MRKVADNVRKVSSFNIKSYIYRQMRIKLKPLSQQVIVITGASSGIGLATAREAALRGAKLVVVSRNEDLLRSLTHELQQQGCQAIHVVADVGVEAEVHHVADRAIEHFGGFDTWVNNAGVSIYGSLDDPTTEENRRLFDTNFWGVVYSSLIARKHLRQRGGAIITVGSLASDIGTPVQGMYSASKHAIKGFIDALRVETEKEGAAVSITLIKPASINSMLPGNARNYMPEKPSLPPPVYAPEVVGNAILYAAEHPIRDIFAGDSAVVGSNLAHFSPRFIDKIMQTFAISYQKSKEKEDRSNTGNLFRPADKDTLQVSPDRKGVVFAHSPYTKAVTTWKRPLLAIGATAVLLGLLRYKRSHRLQQN